MAKMGKESKAVVAEILKEPITGTFGGKAAEVQAMIDVLEAIGKKEDYISPTMMAKVAWGVIRDGRMVQGKAKVPKRSKAEEPDEEDEEEDEIQYYTEDELTDLSAKELREEAEFFEVKLTKACGGKKGKITGKARTKLIEAIMAQYPDDVFEEEEDEEEDEEDEEPWTRKDLNAMTPKKVLEVADAWEIDYTKKQKNELLKKKDFRWMVEAILTSQEGGDIEDVGVDLYTKKELGGFEEKELHEIAKDWELPLKKNTKRPYLIKAILKFQKDNLE